VVGSVDRLVGRPHPDRVWGGLERVALEELGDLVDQSEQRRDLDVEALAELLLDADVDLHVVLR